MLDYMVMEAVAIKIRKEDERAAADARRKQAVAEEKERLKRQYA